MTVMNSSTFTTTIHAVIVTVAIVCVTVLAVLHDVGGQVAAGFIGVAAGVSFGVGATSLVGGAVTKAAAGILQSSQQTSSVAQPPPAPPTV